jgi:HD domain
MHPSISANELLEEFEFLFAKYSQELRATTQPYQLARLIENYQGYEYRPQDVLVRETLMEHVGSLPMVATTFYPYIDDDDVDLGRALVMLAIHDIGELVTGDESTFTKKADPNGFEQEAALRLLHSSYHETYKDVEAKGSQTAKFAKSIDKVTPDIFDYLTPAEVTIARFRHFVGMERDEIVGTIIDNKRPYMLWNPFMTEFHELLCDRLATKLTAAPLT